MVAHALEVTHMSAFRSYHLSLRVHRYLGVVTAVLPGDDGAGVAVRGVHKVVPDHPRRAYVSPRQSHSFAS